MGLLSRAANTTFNKQDPTAAKAPPEDVQIDEMGKALRERIMRLPVETHTPHTVLNLLKAYSSFQTGLCLLLKNGVYTSYASVGLGVDKISIPQENIWSEERAAQPYFKYESDTGKNLEIKSAGEGMEYWVFPLDNSKSASPEPWEGIMILGVPEITKVNTGFDPRSVSAILAGNTDKLFLKPDNDEPENNEDEPENFEPQNNVPEAEPEADYTESNSGDNPSVEERIKKYHQVYADFNCILLEIPDNATEEEKMKFCNKVSDMVNTSGTVIPLPEGRPLILLPKLIDRELIAHRLSRSFNARLLMAFESNSPETVCDQIRSLP